MNATSRMVALLGELRREMNGAVVDSMREKGIEYALSYGVSIPTVRALARQYAPDDELARLLYQQQVRELQLAALSIAVPENVTIDELPFWAKAVTTVEMAENVATVLIARTKIAKESVGEWLAADNALLRYAAMLVGGRCNDLNINDITTALADALRSVPAGLEVVTAHGAAVLIGACGSRSEEQRVAAREFIDALPEGSLRERIEDEAGWQLEQY
ncbi:MAG: DNA alkylation repair protein [Rikenellaceae bacterium]|nr:DNA alkylation repair protein [Rikenellaceae bacterium]